MSAEENNNFDIDCTGDNCNSENHPPQSSNNKNIQSIFHTNIKQYGEFLTAFLEAEEHLKEAELIDPDRNGLLIPSINELRYCSYHISKALSAEKAKEQGIELSRAERHCRRASYDALELGVISYLDDINSTLEPYRGEVVIGEVISDYSAKKVIMHEAQDALKSRSGKDKEEYFSEIAGFLKKLKKIYLEIDNSTDELTIKKIEQDRNIKESRRSSFFSKIVIFLSGVATAAAIVSAYAAVSSKTALVDQPSMSETTKK